MQVVPTFADVKFTVHRDVHGEDAEDVDRIPDAKRDLRRTSHPSRVAMQTELSDTLVAVNDSKHGAATSCVRRVTILGYVHNPTTCGRTTILGFALAAWLAQRRQ